MNYVYKNKKKDVCRIFLKCNKEPDAVPFIFGKFTQKYIYFHNGAFLCFIFFFFNFFFFQYHLGDDLEFHFLKVLERALKEAKPSNCGKLSSVFLMQLQKLLERNKEVHFMMVSDSVSFALF